MKKEPGNLTLAGNANSTLEVSSRLQEASTVQAKQERLLIGLSLLTLFVIWGSTYLGMRIAIETFPPFLMAGIRFVAAGAILYLILRVRGAPAPTLKQWGGAAIIGFFLLVGSNGLVSYAQQWVASGISAIALAAVPLYTALMMGVLGRWPTRLEWVGLAIGFCGVVLLNLQKGIWVNPQGAIALLLAPLSWSLGSVLSTRITLASGLMASAMQMLLGGLEQLVVGVSLGERLTSWPTWRSLTALIYLILFGSLVAYCAYGYLLRKVRPALATSYAYVNPVVALILGVGLANESFTLMSAGAMVVILLGVALVSLRKKRET
uniref:Drug/metabolite exporter YedA n=1 Tax=Thermosporothrix sp. COM3 TaxID=2490863 RepID=A0A455SP94_9CHLR|nr:drug/metabolite exporter YedA [Thermosporothrix sp. COM3]